MGGYGHRPGAYLWVEVAHLKGGLPRWVVQLVAGTTPARRRFPQDATCQQFGDVAQRRVRRTFGDRCPLAAGELAFEAIEQPIEQLYLALVQRRSGPALPEPRFGQHGIEDVLRLVDGPVQGVEKPGKPLGDIERRLLGALQDVVVGIALSLDLRGQAVESLWAAVGARYTRASSRSPMARAIRPLPSSNGCNVTNHKWASPALINGGSLDDPLTQPKNRSISDLMRLAGGASKCTRCRPRGPDTTCIGPRNGHIIRSVPGSTPNPGAAIGAGPGKLGWSLHRKLHPSYGYLAGRNKTATQMSCCRSRTGLMDAVDWGEWSLKTG